MLVKQVKKSILDGSILLGTGTSRSLGATSQMSITDSEKLVSLCKGYQHHCTGETDASHSYFRGCHA